MHTRKSLLFDHQEAWREKNKSTLFDVTMGSFDGAEVCELVGLYILYILTNRFNNNDIGLYRDSPIRSEEHTSELQSRQYLVCRLLLEKKKYKNNMSNNFLSQ